MSSAIGEKDKQLEQVISEQFLREYLENKESEVVDIMMQLYELQIVLEKVKNASIQLYETGWTESFYMVHMPVETIQMNLI